MDTQGTEGRRRRLPRILTTAAMVCFALPFLTVTCYGDTTVSGVQAATGIDLYPHDQPSEQELVREEPPNGFAFVALAAAAIAVALSFGSARSRRPMLWAAAAGVVALEGLFVYAFYRSWGGAWPRIGFVGALMLLVGASWAGLDRVPRWVGWATAGVAASMIPGTTIGTDTLNGHAWLYLPVYVGGFAALALAVGAVRASVRPARVGSERPEPSAARMLAALVAGCACLAIAAVGSGLLMGGVLSGSYGPDGVVPSYGVTFVVLAICLAASVVAWIVGRAIVHGGRRTRFARMRAEVLT
jgi:hypothetical protein